MTYNDKLQIALQNVTDEASFLVFIEALGRDRADEAEKERNNPSSPYGSGANGWEHTTIDGFLEAAVAWAAVSTRMSTYDLPDNVWTRCADILYSGKVYE